MRMRPTIQSAMAPRMRRPACTASVAMSGPSSLMSMRLSLGGSGVQLTGDEGLDHLSSAVGLRARRGDPLVLAVLEDGQVAGAADGPIGRREFFLQRGQHVVVEGALHDQERHQADLLAALEDALGIALEDRLPRVEVDAAVLDHALALHLLRLLEAGVRVTDR